MIVRSRVGQSQRTRVGLKSQEAKNPRKRVFCRIYIFFLFGSWNLHPNPSFKTALKASNLNRSVFESHNRPTTHFRGYDSTTVKLKAIAYDFRVARAQSVHYAQDINICAFKL